MEELALTGFMRTQLSAALAALLAGAGHAATVQVTSNADPGGAATCTLRQALLAMADHGLGSATGNCLNSGAAFGSQDTVSFAFSGPTAIDLATLELHINASVVVQATPSAPVTINAAPSSRALYIAPLTAKSGDIDVTLSYLTLAKGNDPYYGGALKATFQYYIGIVNNQQVYTIALPTVTLDHCVIGGNAANGNTADLGGGLEVDLGTLNVNYSTVSFNKSTNTAEAACYYCGSTFGGGGIYSFAGTINVNNSTISNNSSAGDGGGIQLAWNSVLNVSNSTISGNSSPARGGGIADYFYGQDAALTVSNSTIANNSAAYAGGVYINYSFSGVATISNTILAGNTAASGGAADLISQEPQTTAYFTLFQSSQAAEHLQLTTTSDHNILGTNAMLGALADNGGATLTHLITRESPAFGAGDPAFSGPPYDQRGPGFPRVANGTLDIGAVEAQAPKRLILQHGLAPDQMIMLPAAGEGALAAWSALSGLGALGALRRRRRARC